MKRCILVFCLLFSPINIQGETISVNQTEVVNNIHLSSSFLEYMKNAENGVRKGWEADKALWFPYQDPAGSNVGYGHFLSPNELPRFSKGITEAQAQDLLKSDLESAWNIADKWFISNHNISLLSLDSRKVEMILDFTFNLGSPKFFPKFMSALLSDDKETMLVEYKRYCSGKELTDRNNRFRSRFLTGQS